MIDVTLIPPPCMSLNDAAELYVPAFRRGIEYTSLCRVEGDVLEFGTNHGFTARVLAQTMAAHRHSGMLMLYDSWEGFPEMVGADAGCPEVIYGAWKQGDCNPRDADHDVKIHAALTPILNGRVRTIKGYYSDTLPHNLPVKASVVHIDCDLYSSTMEVLSALIDNNTLSDGAVLYFDEFNNNVASNKFGERKAVHDIFCNYQDGQRFTANGKYSIELWFTYGWSGYAFLVHRG